MLKFFCSGLYFSDVYSDYLITADFCINYSINYREYTREYKAILDVFKSVELHQSNARADHCNGFVFFCNGTPKTS
ncbi:MAG: hypothetical protein LBE18_05585 [Planctomycetaceae bacterium]|nr:hypothetical protein [Planctomycetaceae bacterium]